MLADEYECASAKPPQWQVFFWRRSFETLQPTHTSSEVWIWIWIAGAGPMPMLCLRVCVCGKKMMIENALQLKCKVAGHVHCSHNLHNGFTAEFELGSLCKSKLFLLCLWSWPGSGSGSGSGPGPGPGAVAVAADYEPYLLK